MVGTQKWITEYVNNSGNPNFEKIKEIIQRKGLYTKEYAHKYLGFLKMLEHIGCQRIELLYQENPENKPWIKFFVRDNIYTCWALPVIKDVGVKLIPDFFILKEDTEKMYRGTETIPNLKVPWLLVYVRKDEKNLAYELREANYYLRPKYIVILCSEEVNEKIMFPPNTYVVEFYDINPIKIKEKLSYLF